MDNLIEVIFKKIDERVSTGNDDAFYILDLEDVKMKYRKWVEKMPRVVPFYAIKCNDDERVAKTLADMGTGYDCASKKELEQVLNLGVPPERIIYANTVKQISHLKFAAVKNVMRVTFDCPAELIKIKKHHPAAQVVLRIRFDAEISMVRLGLKFGCDPLTEAPELVKLCRELDMNLIGVSFHVGSGVMDFEVYQKALTAVRDVCNVGKKFGFEMNFVDIGGGFMGNDMSLLDHYASSINSAIEKHFKDPSIMIISEPGRYFVESAFTLATQVILKRVLDGKIHYHLNECIYMSFLISFIYDVDLTFEIIRKSRSTDSNKQILSTIWGSSCNSKDKIIAERLMPEFEMGDWLVFRNMGAYTTTVSTSFNGFQIGDILSLELKN